MARHAPRRSCLRLGWCALVLGMVACGSPPAAAPVLAPRTAASVASSAPSASSTEPPTPSPPPTPTQSPTAAAAPGRIGLGPGFVNNFNHALVRTAADRLYILVNNDNAAQASQGPGYLRMLRATTPGLPTAFEELDPSHRPRSGGQRSAISDAAIAIDGAGLVHVVYQDRDGSGDGTPQIMYVSFDTASDTWAMPEIVRAPATDSPRGYGGVALALDRAGTPVLVYAHARQLYEQRRLSGQWSAPAQISDTDDEAQHPAIAFGPDDRLHIAWFRRGGDELRYRSRAATGQLDPASQSIVRYTRTTLNDVDQGPALTVTADGTLWCAYLDGDEHTRVRRLSAAGWIDAGPSAAVYAHAPTIAAVQNDLWLLLGHDDQIDYAALHRPAGSSWSQKQLLESGTFDGSANARWSWFFNGPSPILDTLFFDEGNTQGFQAQLYYRAIDPAVATAPDSICPRTQTELELMALCGYLPLAVVVRGGLRR